MEPIHSMDDRARDAADACRRLLGLEATGWEDPGGQRRKSTRLFVDDRSVIATRRSSAERAELEVGVLRLLKAEGAAVPGILGFDGRWLIQEDIGGERLSRLLRSAGPEEAERLQDAALASLQEIHEAGQRAGLVPLCFAIGQKPEWLDELAQTPNRLGEFLGVAAPEPDADAIRHALVRAPTSFVKWDARPPNAVALDDGRIAWFDWEHCGVRNRLDDIVWFLGDEAIIDRPKAETRLLNRWVPIFDEGGYPTGPADYVMTFGALHCAVRLALSVSNTARELRPDDWRESLAGGAMESLSANSLRLARRGARWAERSHALKPLGAWFRAIRERFSEA